MGKVRSILMGRSCALFFVFIACFVVLFFTVCTGKDGGLKLENDLGGNSFEKGWRFSHYGPKADSSVLKEPAGLERVNVDDSQWRIIDLPHDWAIEGPFIVNRPNNTGKRLYPGIGWYRKHFKVSSNHEGKRIFVDFDGVMSRPKVYINGEYAGQWGFGYSSFRIELTDHVKFGQDNVLAVRVDNPDDLARWYPGAGIYRHVRLIMDEPVHVAHWGTFVTTPQVTKEAATVRIRAEIENQSKVDVTVSVSHKISEYASPANIISEVKEQQIAVKAGEIAELDVQSIVKEPKLWAIKSPNLYRLTTKVIQDGKVIDNYETIFGIRTIEFNPDKGFLLNDERVQLNGVCLHHDLGPIGAAVHRRAIMRQLELLQEMGCNAIRTAHNPPAPELLEYCDRMGFVVLNEVFDCWKRGKTKGDYQILFEEWHVRDITAMVRRDRNHPCIIMYSSGNEIGEQWDGKDGGHALSRKLTRLFHSLDPTRPVTAGCNQPKAAFNGFGDTVDVFGFNYKPHLYPKFREHYGSSKLFYGSETSACVSSRGEYFFPINKDKSKGFFNLQCSSYDLFSPYWASLPEIEFKAQDEYYPYVAGEFVWTGFDYLGEPTPYNNDETIGLNFHTKEDKEAFEERLAKMDNTMPSRSSYFGIMDLCGFKKDRFYLYQSKWRPELPMAHILPHWNWPDRVGEATPVHVYTTGDSAELFLNGRSLGLKKKGQYEYRLRWDDVIYEPGELKVVAYKDGKQWAKASKATTGEAKGLKLTADRTELDADGRDLCYVTVEVVDESGLMVPRADNVINFSISGPGEIIATGNGNPIDMSSFQNHYRKAFNGLCLVIVRTIEGEVGKVTLTAESEGLRGNKVTIVNK